MPRKKPPLIPDYGSPDIFENRIKYGYFVAVMGIIGNTALFLIKITGAILLGSIAMLAESVHSFADTGTSIIVILGFKASRKPSDKNHPFGHGRAEPIASLILAVILVFTGIEFIRSSFDNLFFPPYITWNILTLAFIIIMLTSAIAKEALARYSISVGHFIESNALVADGWHSRTDALASVAVAFALIGSAFKLSFLDGVFGLVISGLIIWAGVSIARQTIDKLLGTRISDDKISSFRKIIQDIRSVANIHEIQVHNYGMKNVLTFHVIVPGYITARESHRIADEIEARICDEQNSCVVHVEPCDAKCGYCSLHYECEHRQSEL